MSGAAAALVDAFLAQRRRRDAADTWRGRRRISLLLRRALPKAAEQKIEQALRRCCGRCRQADDGKCADQNGQHRRAMMSAATAALRWTARSLDDHGPSGVRCLSPLGSIMPNWGALQAGRRSDALAGNERIQSVMPGHSRSQNGVAALAYRRAFPSLRQEVRRG